MWIRLVNMSASSTARLLQLLALLQARRDWRGPELARRLQVSERTIRKDVSRLRDLGYPIEGTSGPAGGYRFGAGATLPPLLLTDEEAIAVAISLRSAAAGTVVGLEQTALQALVKLEHVLPTRLRHRMTALQAATVHAPASGPRIDPEVLSVLATACRDHQSLRLDYRDHSGNESLRTVEPYRLVHHGRRWFLLAWEIDRDDWRTLRIDRIRPRTPLGPRFVPSELSDADAVKRVTRGVAAAFGAIRTRAVVYASADTVASKLPPVAVVDHIDADSCTLLLGAATPMLLAIYLLGLGADFDVTEPPELLDALDVAARRAQRARRIR